MKQLILYFSIAIASGVLIMNIYNSFIDAKSWGHDIPASIIAAREYFKSVNPGDFFRVISPVNQLLALVALILSWKSHSAVRVYLGSALLFYVLGDMLTFGYFYPRNAIMFTDTPMAATETLKKAWSEWDQMNWIRSLIVLSGLVFSGLGLHWTYRVES